MRWGKVKLGDFLINRENRYKPKDETISGLKRIDKIDFSGQIYLSEKPTNTDMIIIKNGDLVISGINVEKGAMSVYEGNEDVTATIHYSSYRYNEKKIDIDFLKYFLRSTEFKEAIKEQVPGGIKTEIKPKHLLPLEIIIPTDIVDQKRVISEFQKTEKKNSDFTAELTHQLSLVSQLRHSFLREATQGKLLPQDLSEGHAKDLLATIKSQKDKQGIKEKPLPPIKLEDIPFEIPKNWVWCRLGELITLVSGQDLIPFDYSDIDASGIPYITGASNLDNGNIIINRWTNKPKALAYKFDLLLTCKGSGVGKMALLNEPIVHIARQIMAIRSNMVLIEYLMIIISLKGESYKSNAKSLIPGIDRGVVLNTEIPLPPLLEQHRIVAKLNQLMQTCDALEASIKQSKEQNEKLLQQVLRESLINNISPDDE